MSSLASVALAQSCGVASLFDLSELAGRELNNGQRRELVQSYPADESSMLDIKRAAEKLELPLVDVDVERRQTGLGRNGPGRRLHELHLGD
jgi:hypothetical protein